MRTRLLAGAALMMRTRLLAGAALMLVAVALPQEKPQPRARELFYTPIPDAKPAPQKEAAPKAAVAKPARPKSSQPAPTNAAPLQNASTVIDEVVGPPLVLKYRLLKLSSSGSLDEVDTDAVFRSGEQMRVSVESNDDAYLYIVQQGSSRTWETLFPNPDTPKGGNRIERKRVYEVPQGEAFTFRPPTGAESLFIVLSRRPEPDLDNLIYALSQNGAATPAATTSPDKNPQTVIAQNRIQDSVISRLRSSPLSRDLVREKVNDVVAPPAATGFRKEKAMYVATPDQTSNARVVADLTLNHQ